MRQSRTNQTVAHSLICRWVVHRHHLHTGLSESARRHGATLIIDARVASIDQSTNPVRMTTEKGAEYKFDLLIGSDGLKSIVRKTLFPNVKPRAPTKNAAYRGIIPYEEVFAKVPEAKSLLGNAIDVWGSPGGYCITYPISGGKDLNLVLSHHNPDYVEDVQEVNMDELRGFYKDYDPVIKKVIDLVPSSLRWPLLVTGPLESWSNASKNVVLMGRCSSLDGQSHGSRRGNFYGRWCIPWSRHFGGCSWGDHPARSYLHLREDPDASGLDQTASFIHSGRNLHVLRR